MLFKNILIGSFYEVWQDAVRSSVEKEIHDSVNAVFAFYNRVFSKQGISLLVSGLCMFIR